MLDIKIQLEVAKKAKRIIESCVNEIQLDNARNYVNLFFERFAFPVKDTELGTVYEADHSTVKLYNNLINILEKKEKKFTKQLDWME